MGQGPVPVRPAGHGMVHMSVWPRRGIRIPQADAHARGPGAAFSDCDPAPGSFTTAWAPVPDAAMAGPMSGWGNLTALGIVAVVLAFIVTKILPDGHRKFIEQAELHSKAEAEARAAFLALARGVWSRNRKAWKRSCKRIERAVCHAPGGSHQGATEGSEPPGHKGQGGAAREKRGMWCGSDLKTKTAHFVMLK